MEIDRFELGWLIAFVVVLVIALAAIIERAEFVFAFINSMERGMR